MFGIETPRVFEWVASTVERRWSTRHPRSPHATSLRYAIVPTVITDAQIRVAVLARDLNSVSNNEAVLSIDSEA